MRIKSMIKIVPEPDPIEYRREFFKEEILVALRHYLTSNGVEVPTGIENLWGGLETVSMITLV